MNTIAKNTLLAFVLISIGFALGKEVTERRHTAAGGPISPALAETGDRVIVYYLHTTFRCVSCNELERLSKALLETEFAEELAAGRIEWREANFQQDDALAKRYNVIASCVVVANVEDGRETNFQRLDDVWTRYQDPLDFNEYVGSAIKKYLEDK
jgi:NDP-sugar pyrophosphorylase family protein